MTDPRATPGPWEAEGLDQRTDADRPVLARTKSGHPFWIARVYGEGVLAPVSAERVANARLISAAPDLLAACEATIAGLHDMTSEDFSKGADRPMRLLKLGHRPHVLRLPECRADEPAGTGIKLETEPGITRSGTVEWDPRAGTPLPHEEAK